MTAADQRAAAIARHLPDGFHQRPRSPHSHRPSLRCCICDERLAVVLAARGQHLTCGTTAYETPDWS